MLTDQNLAGIVLDMLRSLIEACLKMIENGERQTVETLGQDSLKVILALKDGLHDSAAEIPISNVDQSLCSIEYSLLRILEMSDPKKTVHKIEFELLPLIQEFYLNFYYWSSVYPDEEKMRYYEEHEKAALGGNFYIDTSMEQDAYKYELSIIVTGYNKLNYTKKCVTSLLKYLPKDLNYELILINHGSTDGTKEYFESINPDKQVDIKINGGGLGVYMRIIEGRYSLAISNDVVITENAIENMLRCIRDDQKVAMIVPSTSNIANLQTIEAKYSSEEEMHQFAHSNNQYDPFRHEQRTRLCNPLVMYRTDVLFSSSGLLPYRVFFTDNSISFGDDRASLLLRRAGYKLILQKDAYCHHFGSVTINDDLKKLDDNAKKQGEQDFYTKGRSDFKKAFGIDPWDKGFCYDPVMLGLLEIKPKRDSNILGIDCGMGSDPLKIKESIREAHHDATAKIYNLTSEESWLPDLKALSEATFFLQKSEHDMSRFFSGVTFDYVVIESKQMDKKLFQSIWSCVNKGGQVAIKSMPGFTAGPFKNKAEIRQNQGWIVMTKLGA